MARTQGPNKQNEPFISPTDRIEDGTLQDELQLPDERLVQVLPGPWQCKGAAGFQRAVDVFWIFRFYDVLMVLSMLSMRPTLEANVSVCLWASLTAFFCFDLVLAGNILGSLNTWLNVRYADAMNEERYPFDGTNPRLKGLVHYYAKASNASDAELKQLAYYNFVSNTVTLSLWMLYHSFCLNNALSFGVLAASAIRLVKLRPVCQFYDALYAKDVGLALDEFANSSIWSKGTSSVQAGHKSRNHWHSTHTALAFILLLAFGLSVYHSVTSTSLPAQSQAVSLAATDDDSCDAQGGECFTGSCWLTGMGMGVFTGLATSALASVWNARQDAKPGGGLKIPMCAVCINGAACFIAGIMGGAREHCATPGIHDAFASSWWFETIIAAVVAN